MHKRGGALNRKDLNSGVRRDDLGLIVGASRPELTADADPPTTGRDFLDHDGGPPDQCRRPGPQQRRLPDVAHRQWPHHAQAVTAKAASWTGRPRPTAPTMAATTAATASSPNASVAVTTSATPSSAAKTSHTIHDPMVTPGAGAAGEKPTYRANVRGSPTSLYLTVTPPWRADTMTYKPAHPLAKGSARPACPKQILCPGVAALPFAKSPPDPHGGLA